MRRRRHCGARPFAALLLGLLSLTTSLRAQPERGVDPAAPPPLTAGPSLPEAAPPGAEAPPPPPPEPSRRPPTRGEAEAAGFTGRPADESPGSLLAGGLALGPGLLIHGLGHAYAGDTTTATALFAAELAGMALLAAALILDTTTDGAGELGGLRQGLQHAGVILFMGSWGADVLGAFKGSVALERDRVERRDSRLGLAYRYTDDHITAFRHHLVLHLDLDLRHLFLRPLIDLEGGARLRQYQLEAGRRLLRGSDRHEHLDVGLRLRRVEDQTHGFATRGALGFVDYKVDLGRALTNLRHLYLFGRLGYGWDGYQLGQRAGEVPSLFGATDLNDTYLLIQTGLGFNPGQRTHLTLSALRDPTRDIPGFATGLGGLLELRLIHRQSDDLDIEFSGTLGDGFGLLLGLGYAL